MTTADGLLLSLFGAAARVTGKQIKTGTTAKVRPFRIHTGGGWGLAASSKGIAPALNLEVCQFSSDRRGSWTPASMAMSVCCLFGDSVCRATRSHITLPVDTELMEFPSVLQPYSCL